MMRRRSAPLDGFITEDYTQPRDEGWTVEDMTAPTPRTIVHKRKRVDAATDIIIGADDRASDGKPPLSLPKSEGGQPKSKRGPNDILSELQETRISLANYAARHIKDQKKADDYKQKILQSDIHQYAARFKASTVVQGLFKAGQYHLLVKGMLSAADITDDEIVKFKEGETLPAIKQKLADYVQVIGTLINKM